MQFKSLQSNLFIVNAILQALVQALNATDKVDQKVEALSHLSSRSSVIRVTVPANVANDLDLFTKMLKDLGGRIGCKPCISGAACFFDNERDFVVNPAGQILAH